MTGPESSAGKLTTREQLAREVQDVLSMRLPSDAPPAGSRPTSSKLLPGTPGKAAAGPPPAGLLLQNSMDSSKTAASHHQHPSSEPVINGVGAQAASSKNVAKPPAGRQPPGNSSHASLLANGSSMAGISWMAELAAQDDSTAGKKHSCCARAIASLRRSSRSVVRVVRARPYVLAVSLLLTLAMAAAGIVGVLAASRTETRHRKESALGFANNAASAFSVQLQQAFAPLTALSVLIHFQPYYPDIAKAFDGIAQELLDQLPMPGAIASLQATPQGVVRSFYPLKGNEKAMNHDLFRDPERRPAALATVRNGNLTMQGPVKLLQGFTGAVARIPLFISNVSEDNFFGAPSKVHDCDICYNRTTRTRFWGFVSCIVKLADLANGKDARLAALTEMGYNYEFFARQPDGGSIQIAASPVLPFDPVTVSVLVPNNEWQLMVAPQQGWVPNWRDPMLATVIIISVFVGLLVFATLVSRHMQQWLLKEMKASNRALAEEKVRMDVLLARQYNLISTLAEQGALSGKGGSGSLSSLEEKTLNRIEAMRREIGVASFSSGGDELQLMHLLGEGTFGKVYKGIWRGSTVAIKTMILPANMSGTEKRERMAIMEAAISSTMQHPNIVQTYTYTIKPASDSSRVQRRPAELPGTPGSPPAEQEGSAAFSSDTPASHVHSYEVNIVLEYCDWGCLRDALDAGSFFTPRGSLNYGAVLDTAADVAKAMLHLHCNQVVHSDLKVRNVLLKSDGSSERGCVAKVADFGLAVKMDNQDTHVSAFQGTMSHMAPEALVRGHISKAADVYSFGITLWELFTGGHAYMGIPRALLGHQVVSGLRPSFPDFTPSDYRALAERCWQADPVKRPTFAEVLDSLQRMRSRASTTTSRMTPFVPRTASLAGREAAELAALAGGSPNSATTPSSVVRQAQVAAAQAAGIVQMQSLQSYYVNDDMASTMDQHLPLQHHHDDGSSVVHIHEPHTQDAGGGGSGGGSGGGGTVLLGGGDPGGGSSTAGAPSWERGGRLAPIQDDAQEGGGDDAGQSLSTGGSGLADLA